MKNKLIALVAVASLCVINSQLSTARAQFSPGARSAGDPYLPAIGNGGYDVQHYDLTINYNPVTNTMVSRADITIRATQGLSEFSLDLRGFPGATATIDGIAAGVARIGDKLIVTPTAGIESNRVFHAVMDYSGTPAQIQDPDTSFEGWVPITGGAFVVNEPMGAMGWFPCNNAPSDKATYDFHITVPNAQTALGNGELASKVNNGDGTTTWNWHMGVPMATYLSTATVGLFDYTKTFSATNLGVSGNPLEIYNAFESALSASQKTAATTAAGRQDGIIKFIADEIGAPYAFDSTGVVLHRTSLGYTLEVQTKTHFSGTSISLTTLAHETAHQWFGDNVSPATWREIWFNEGFATWWEWYWGNKQGGSTTTVEQRFTSNYSSTSQPTRWNTPPANLPDASDMFDTFTIYTRPAMMLEAYRQIVGNSTFFAFQRALLSEHAYGTISGAQFIALAKRLAQERSGFDANYLAKLDEFFQQWLYGVGKPTLIPTTFFLDLQPRLALRFISASQLEIAWPSTSDPFLLEETDDLTSASWTTVSQSQTVNNGETKVRVVPPAGNHFYRLRKN
ncbi:MAG: M1 family metallopeptidase [Limisphaerales bacterium]